MKAVFLFFFFSSRRRHTRFPKRDWSSDVCSSDLVQQWNLNVQRLLPKGILVEIGYVGSHSVHFDAPQTVNPYVPGSTTTRIYPQFGPIESINLDAAGSYHGLLTKLEKSFSRGLTFLQTYSFNKTARKRLV